MLCCHTRWTEIGFVLDEGGHVVEGRVDGLGAAYAVSVSHSGRVAPYPVSVQNTPHSEIPYVSTGHGVGNA
eukprot:2125141-Rhodomonas_salina.3